MGTKLKHPRVPVQPHPGPRIPTTCNNLRAGHFCELPVGHKGSHARDSGLWVWEDPPPTKSHRKPTACNEHFPGAHSSVCCQLTKGHSGLHSALGNRWPNDAEEPRPRGRPKGLARHPAGCVTLTVGGEKPTCCYLADGTKVTIKRGPEVKGSVYLAVEQQATIFLAASEFDRLGEDVLNEAGKVKCQTLGDFIDGLKRIAKAVQDRLDAIEHGEDEDDAVDE